MINRRLCHLAPRTRRTHLHCKIVETMRMQATRFRGEKMLELWHDITLSCDKPYIKEDRRK